MDLMKLFGLMALAIVGMAAAAVLMFVNTALAALALIVLGALIFGAIWYVVRAANSPSRPPE